MKRSLLLLWAVTGALAWAGDIRLIRTPSGGIQPQVAVDEKGAVHLIYFQGEPGGGDVFYVKREPGHPERNAPGDGRDFSRPMRVNSRPNSVIATGTVRGAHIALGKRGRVHVAWMGAKGAEPAGPNGAHPMLYTRMNDRGTAFEPERNVMQFAAGLDGGGSLAADSAGNVYVAWHAGSGDPENTRRVAPEHGSHQRPPEGRSAAAKGHGEENRRVWIARSSDEGKTFARETPAYDEPTGACGCCGMRAFAAGPRNVYMLYRAATEHVNRDMVLLASNDRGRTFRGDRIHPWKIGACPMSTASFTAGSTAGNAAGNGPVVAAWETEWQIFFATIDARTGKVSEPVAAPGEGGKRKHPVVARNAAGQTLLVWTEGTGFRKGGSLAWQLFDQDRRPLGEKGAAPDVPASSLPAVLAEPGGGFTIIY